MATEEDQFIVQNNILFQQLLEQAAQQQQQKQVQQTNNNYDPEIFIDELQSYPCYNKSLIKTLYKPFCLLSRKSGLIHMNFFLHFLFNRFRFILRQTI